MQVVVENRSNQQQTNESVGEKKDFLEWTSLIISGPALGMGGGCKYRTMIFCL